MNFNKQLLSILTIFSIVSILCTETLISGCGSKQVKVKDTTSIDSIKLDTVDNGDIAKTIVYDLSQTLSDTKDSVNRLTDSVYLLKIKIAALTKVKDSLVKVNSINYEALGVAQYKLLRIREYNRIAGQGKNLQFLRGWINRTLK